MLRLLVAAIAGIVSFFLFFWILTWLTGSNTLGAYLALPLGFIGVPIAVLVFWHPKESTGRWPRHRILGAVGAMWGSAMLIQGLLYGRQGTGAYAQGQSTAIAFGGIMFAVGIYYLFKRNSGGNTKRDPKDDETRGAA